MKALAAAAVLLLALAWLTWERDAPEVGHAEPAAPPQLAERRAGVAQDRPGEEAGTSDDSSRVTLVAPGQQLVLGLARWPDGKRIARAVVGLAFDGPPDAPDGPRFSDADGRLVVEAPGGARVVEVEVAGFETETVDLSTAVRASAEHELRLRPLSGLFGRVVFENGEPAGGATVRLVRRIEMTSVSGPSNGPPRVNLSTLDSTSASTTTTKEGWYFLEWPTRTSTTPIELVCDIDDAPRAKLEVQLPRATEPLSEIVLAEPRYLTLRVLDEDGRPIAGAEVWGLKERRNLKNRRSDARGECQVLDPALPAAFFAATRSSVLCGVRVDGEDHEPGHPVASLDQRVELILRQVASAEFRVVDQETGAPIPMASGDLEFLDSSGTTVSTLGLRPDREGVAETVLVPPRRAVQDIEIARIRVELWADGYEPFAEEFPAAELGDGEPRTFRLRPLEGTHFVRGRVMRAGQPAPGVQVGVIGLLPRTGSARGIASSARCFSDDQGRFAVRWSPRDPAELVALRPHWTNLEEFGVLGPMPVSAALDRELLLQIEPGLRVPAILRGVNKGGRYVLLASIVQAEGLVPTTVNGAPIEAWQDGEIQTHVFVPSEWPSRLTVGYRTDSHIRPEASQPVFFDPAAPALPLVFELPPLFARIEGVVAGVAPVDSQGLRVIAVQASSPELDPSLHLDRSVLAVVEPGEDGSFVLGEVRMGACDLLLVRMAGGSSTKLLASERVQVERDITGLVLRAQPEATGQAR